MTSVLLPLQPTGSDRLAAESGAHTPSSGSELLPFTQAMSDATVSLANTQTQVTESAQSSADESSNSAQAATPTASETAHLLTQLGSSISLTVSAKVPSANPQSVIGDLVIKQVQDLKDQAEQTQNLNALDVTKSAAQSDALAATQALADSDMVLIGENLQANLIKLGQASSAQNQDAQDSRMMIQIVPSTESANATSTNLRQANEPDLITADQIKAIIFNPDDQTCHVQISMTQHQSSQSLTQDEHILTLTADIVSVQSAPMGELSELPKTIVFQGLNDNSPLYRIEIKTQTELTTLQVADDHVTQAENALLSSHEVDPKIQSQSSHNAPSGDLTALSESLFTPAHAMSIDTSEEATVESAKVLKPEDVSSLADHEVKSSVSINVFMMKAMKSEVSVDQDSDPLSKLALNADPHFTASETSTTNVSSQTKADHAEDDDQNSLLSLTEGNALQATSLSDQSSVSESVSLSDLASIAQSNFPIMLPQDLPPQQTAAQESASQADLINDTPSRQHNQAAILKAQILLAQTQHNFTSAPSAERLSHGPVMTQALQQVLPQSQTRQHLSGLPNRSFANPAVTAEANNLSLADRPILSSDTPPLPNQSEPKSETINPQALDKLQAKQIDGMGPQKHEVIKGQTSNGFSEEMIRTLDQMNGSIQINLGDQRDSQTLTQPVAQATSGAELGQRDVRSETSLSDPNAASRQTRSLTAEIRVRALERQVIYAAQANHDEVRMQLYPPGLGLIVIKLTMDGSKLTMKTKATNAEAVDALNALESDLKSSLSGHGIELTGFAVSDKDPDADRRQKDTPNQEDKVNQSVTDGAFALDLNA